MAQELNQNTEGKEEESEVKEKRKGKRKDTRRALSTLQVVTFFKVKTYFRQ